jgi:hypothetical protein
MKIKYENWNPHKKSKVLVDKSNEIIAQQTGRITLRGLYYQLVGRLDVKSGDKAYRGVMNVLGRARLAGLISWEAVESNYRTHSLKR